MTYNPILSSRDVDDNRNDEIQSLKEMDSIAYGVDARINSFDFHSRVVTQKTAEIARWLDLPEKEIDRWEIARNDLELERDKKLNTTLSKLEQNPVAQMILGLAQSTYHFPRSGERQN